MRRFTFVMMLVCALMPATAHANSGGFWDWLYSLDPKLQGLTTDFHLLCLDENGTAVKPCEEWFLIPHLFNPDRTPVPFARIKHEIDFRVAGYWMYGERFSDVADSRSINAFKLMAFYRYYPDPHLSIGLGAGYMPFFGDGFESFTRGVLTPLSVVYAPARPGNGWKSSFVVRAESTYIMEGFTGADFGNTQTAYSKKGEWNFSFGTGFDFRRR
jgi:hypothetical protein